MAKSKILHSTIQQSENSDPENSKENPAIPVLENHKSNLTSPDVHSATIVTTIADRDNDGEIGTTIKYSMGATLTLGYTTKTIGGGDVEDDANSSAEVGASADGKEEATPDGGDVQSDTKGHGDVVGDSDAWVEVFTSAMRTRETMIQDDGDLIWSDNGAEYRISVEDGAFAKEDADEAARSSSSATCRDPSQIRNNEIHHVLPLVPVAALLASAFPWNRGRDPQEEDEVESPPRSSGGEIEKEWNHGRESVTDVLAPMEELLAAADGVPLLPMAYSCCNTTRKMVVCIGVLGFYNFRNDGRARVWLEWSFMLGQAQTTRKRKMGPIHFNLMNWVCLNNKAYPSSCYEIISSIFVSLTDLDKIR